MLSSLSKWLKFSYVKVLAVVYVLLEQFVVVVMVLGGVCHGISSGYCCCSRNDNNTCNVDGDEMYQKEIKADIVLV